ncbi:fibrillin-2 [Bicyclus anynana]|uniref:Fibrillin-2 n=1 Tax=Bicyclus anynana TaxID=110368 RepID=A0ABM3M169_BICAN|nr:fibrillin-2 [Bicyclus anynana]
MKILIVLNLVCLASQFVTGEDLTSDEIADITEICCKHGETYAVASTTKSCTSMDVPDDIEPEETEVCLSAGKKCCQNQMKQKEECATGMTLALLKRCMSPNSDIGKSCCDECTFGRMAGESQGTGGCGSLSEDYFSPSAALRQRAYYQCCMDAVEIETTTKQKPETTTTEKPKEKCKANSCDHICTEEYGRVRCECRNGFRLQADKKSCKDINECAESLDDLCTATDTVCHNTEGSFKCVPLKKRDVSLSCPPGFKRNVINQVCDDINECRSPRPPCPKYLCENTIGGYKCGGKPGKPYTEDDGASTTEPSDPVPTVKNEICPPGFRAGSDDECLDIDECEERLDDCQRLSQHCINTHGNYFCQDHVSKRCSPGFKVNVATGICEDIDECEESSEVCKRNEVCINLPGAYNCKSKISTLPKLATKKCQEGTRVRPGGTICEDIDECREGSHLCDRFQNCINTFGGHECRCKNGFELDSTSASCVDVDECAMKLDNCAAGLQCLNVLGSFTCTRTISSSTTSTTTESAYEYVYYDSGEDENTVVPVPSTTPTTSTSTTSTTTTTTPKPTTSTTTRRPRYPTPRYPYFRPTYRPRTTTTTTPAPPRPTYPEYTRRPVPGTFTEVTNTTESNITPYRPRTTSTPAPSRPYPEYPRRPVAGTLAEVTTTTLSSIPDRGNGFDNDIDFDPNELHCLNGYERNERGECVDVNECNENRHICGSLEVCKNRAGGYECDCMPGFTRDSSGWCVVVTTSTTPRPTTTSTTPRPTTSRPTTPRTTTPRPTPKATTPTTPRVTSTEVTTAASTTPGWWHHPDRGHYSPPSNCELGYIYSQSRRKCIDIDECATMRANCAPTEDCVNTIGGYRCVCGQRCRDAVTPTHPYYEPTPPSVSPDSTVITVGAQYGQAGPRYLRPTYTRLQDSGAIVTTCPWGYKLTPERICLDIDECERNVSECGAQQRCENFYGGFSCQCPAGHRNIGKNCEDIDECSYGNTCSYNARCVNTVGSFKCECSEGFRNAPSNDKVCVDVDECAETPTLCEQKCANAWGGYRCYCDKGYRLRNDSRTCVDIDECEEFSRTRSRGRLCGGRCVNVAGSYRCSCPAGYRLADDKRTCIGKCEELSRTRSRGRLCGGRCVNVAGSYRCSCPAGYRLADDKRTCIDIDECENGEAKCGQEEGQVCQNTQGGYHCHRIDCPRGYRLEGKHKCTRIQRSCPVSDWSCLHQPSAYSYNFITFVSHIFLPAGSVDLFSMQGPAWRDSVVHFEMKMLSVQASPGVTPADISCFGMRPTAHICVVSLQCSLDGPQVAELELTMSLYQRSLFAGSAVARLVVIVSEYDF